MDHPQGLERPWVTPSERTTKGEARREAERERKAPMCAFNEAVQLEQLGLDLERRLEKGESLSFMERTLLERWRTSRTVLDGIFPTGG